MDRPIVARHLAVLGKHLNWHGSLAVDYLYDPATGTPRYIDASPRLVEPMNAALNGSSIPELQVQLSLQGEIPPSLQPTRSKRSHMLMMALLRLAELGAPRQELLREAYRALRHSGIYAGSTEELTNIGIDWPGLIPIAFVLTQLLINPGSVDRINNRAVENYALTAESVRIIREKMG